MGNSAYVLIVVTGIMPIFFKEIASRGIADAVSTANWGFANSSASLVLAVLAPLLGSIGDYENLKKKFFLFFLCIGIVFTLLLVSCKPGAWFYCLSIYVGSHIGWAAANIFYDSFIVDVTDKQRMDSISSRGYAYGYIGSVIPFLLVIAVILLWPGDKTAPLSQAPAKIGFIIAAAWWLLFSAPMLKNVRHTHFIKRSTQPVRDGFVRLAGTFKKIKKFKQAFVFLIAYFFYIDGVDTIISMAAVYGLDLGLNAAMLILAILMIQITAFPFALLFGTLAEKYSAKFMIFVGIGVYSLITLIAFFLPTITDLKLRTFFFWILAFLTGTSMGGIQALSRSYFGKLIPADQSAEFFGFYNIFGKFAAISGPFIMGIITRLTGHARFGVLGILLLFIIGGALLKSVKEPHRDISR